MRFQLVVALLGTLSSVSAQSVTRDDAENIRFLVPKLSTAAAPRLEARNAFDHPICNQYVRPKFRGPEPLELDLMVCNGDRTGFHVGCHFIDAMWQTTSQVTEHRRCQPTEYCMEVIEGTPPNWRAWCEPTLSLRAALVGGSNERKQKRVEWEGSADERPAKFRAVVDTFVDPSGDVNKDFDMAALQPAPISQISFFSIPDGSPLGTRYNAESAITTRALTGADHSGVTIRLATGVVEGIIWALITLLPEE